MTGGRKAMRRVLQQRLVPVLREKDFSGSLPHFRRARDTTTDFLSVQFDKWGGAFVLEVGQMSESERPAAFADVPFAELTTFHLPLAARARLMLSDGVVTDGWFRYDRRRPWWKFWARVLTEADQQAAAADDAIRLFPQAEAWWMGERPQPNILPFLDA